MTIQFLLMENQIKVGQGIRKVEKLLNCQSISNNFYFINLYRKKPEKEPITLKEKAEKRWDS